MTVSLSVLVNRVVRAGLRFARL